VTHGGDLGDAALALLRFGTVVPTAGNRTVSREEWDVQFVDIFEQINAGAGGNPINVVTRDVLPPRS
jgi:D-3-phosphoglycerate dehydrogenase / 2-oxoglutarate reductase